MNRQIKITGSNRLPAIFIDYVKTLSLVFEITNVATRTRVKRKIANRSYQRINTKSKNCEEEISASSRFPTVGFQRAMVDNKATNKTQEESK